jgi:hypothetical protein
MVPCMVAHGYQVYGAMITKVVMPCMVAHGYHIYEDVTAANFSAVQKECGLSCLQYGGRKVLSSLEPSV